MFLLGFYILQVSDSVAGKARPELAREVARAFAEEAKASGRFRVDTPAQVLVFLAVDADSSKTVIDLQELRKNPVLRILLPSKKQKDTVFYYSIWLEARFVDVESGQVLAAFKARGRGLGESWQEARKFAISSLRGEVARQIREAFQLEGKVKKVWGTPWRKFAKIDIGKGKGLRRGEAFGIWRPLGPVRRRVGLGRVVKVKKDRSILRIEQGAWRVKHGDIAVEEPLIPSWGAEAHAVARAGFLWADSSLGPLRGFYAGAFREAGAVVWGGGVELEALPPFRGARLWFGPRLELGLLPEFIYLEPEVKLGLAWHLQPITDTAVEAETANSVGFAVRPQLSASWKLGSDAALVVGAGWHLELRSPWFAWVPGDLASEKGERSTKTITLSEEALWFGNAGPVGFTLWAGLRFKPW